MFSHGKIALVNSDKTKLIKMPLSNPPKGTLEGSGNGGIHNENTRGNSAFVPTSFLLCQSELLPHKEFNLTIRINIINKKCTVLFIVKYDK